LFQKESELFTGLAGGGTLVLQVIAARIGLRRGLSLLARPSRHCTTRAPGKKRWFSMRRPT